MELSRRILKEYVGNVPDNLASLLRLAVNALYTSFAGGKELLNSLKILSLILPILSGSIIRADADILYLKNGRAMEGIIKAEDQDNIDLEVFGGAVRFRKSEIDRIEKTNQEASDALRKRWEKKRVEIVIRTKEEQIRKEFERFSDFILVMFSFFMYFSSFEIRRLEFESIIR